MRAEAEMPSARRSDTPRSVRIEAFGAEVESTSVVRTGGAHGQECGRPEGMREENRNGHGEPRCSGGRVVTYLRYTLRPGPKGATMMRIGAASSHDRPAPTRAGRYSVC
jgi:hypothetical protein